MRRLIEAVYYWTAMHMPMGIGAQYVMNARFYFECHEQPEFRGWPWKWRMEWERLP